MSTTESPEHDTPRESKAFLSEVGGGLMKNPLRTPFGHRFLPSQKKSTYANSHLDSPIRWALPLIRLLQGVPPLATALYFWWSLVQAAPGHIVADQHIIRLNEEENWCNVILRIHHCAPLNG